MGKSMMGEHSQMGQSRLTLSLFLFFFIFITISSATCAQWNSETEEASKLFPVDFHIVESEEVEFSVKTSDLSHNWSWSVNEEVKESEGESADFNEGEISRPGSRLVNATKTVYGLLCDIFIVTEDEAEGSYPMLQYDAQRTGNVSGIAPETGTLMWQSGEKTSGCIEAGPIVSDGKVYISTWWSSGMGVEGNGIDALYCLNDGTGEEIWNNTDVYGASTAAIANGKLFVGTHIGNITCIDAASGDIEWSKKIEENPSWKGVASSPLVVEDKVYVLSSSDGTLHAFSFDGAELGNFSTGGEIFCYASPSTYGDKIYFAGNKEGQHALYCLDLNMSDEVWNFTTETMLRGSPSIWGEEEMVFFTSEYIPMKEYGIYAVNMITGEEIWNVTHYSTWASPALSNGKLYIGGSTVDTTFYCYDALNGTLLWENEEMGGSISSSPVVADGKVYFGTNEVDGTVYALDAENGSKLWNYTLHIPEGFGGGFNIASPPAISNSSLFIGVDNVGVLAFRDKIAGASCAQWNSETEDESADFYVDIHIDESKEVEFSVNSSVLSHNWSWSVNGEEIEESKGVNSNLSYTFEEYGIYNVCVVGVGVGETTERACWNVTVSLVIGEENDLRELEGLEDYTFKISKRPARIVSLAPSCTEMLFAVGAGDSVVGVTEYCDYPSEVEAKKDKGEIVVIGGYSTPNIERIMDLEPDLIVAAYGNPSDILYWLVDDKTHPDIEYPVYAQNPEKIEAIFAHMNVLGTITKSNETASSLLDDSKYKIAEIEERTEMLESEQRPRVFRPCPGFVTCGNNTFLNDVIWTAGGENIAAKYFAGWGALKIEDIIHENPQVILCPATEEGESLAYVQIIGEERLKDVDAVRNNRIYLIIDGLISRPGPRVANATEKVLECLYGLFNVPIGGSTEINGAYFGVPKVTLELSAKENIALRLNITEVNGSEMANNVPETVIGDFVRLEVNESGDLETIDSVVINMGYDEVVLEEVGLEETAIKIRYYNASEEEWKLVKTDVSTEDNIASAGFSCLNEGIYGLTITKNE
ncbi:ABC-type Fe3+-hydroxamate transport system, substrate-binding protein [Methanophagales archaeon]|nr:ABC-type Fe3+-hydroxamate transport system, substrate-binding protein [Methanophagales archaeon]